MQLHLVRVKGRDGWKLHNGLYADRRAAIVAARDAVAGGALQARVYSPVISEGNPALVVTSGNVASIKIPEPVAAPKAPAPKAKGK